MFGRGKHRAVSEGGANTWLAVHSAKVSLLFVTSQKSNFQNFQKSFFLNLTSLTESPRTESADNISQYILPNTYFQPNDTFFQGQKHSNPKMSSLRTVQYEVYSCPQQSHLQGKS